MSFIRKTFIRRQKERKKKERKLLSIYQALLVSISYLYLCIYLLFFFLSFDLSNKVTALLTMRASRSTRVFRVVYSPGHEEQKLTGNNTRQATIDVLSYEDTRWMQSHVISIVRTCAQIHSHTYTRTHAFFEILRLLITRTIPSNI